MLSRYTITCFIMETTEDLFLPYVFYYKFFWNLKYFKYENRKFYTLNYIARS